jgi:sulfotransferase family protein
VKVLYIAGKGRSGTTLLTNLLGELPGFFAVGELLHLWRGWQEGFTCGCRRKYWECEVWSRVVPTTLEEASVSVARAVSLTRITAEDVRRWETEIHRWSSVPRLIRDRKQGRTRWPALKGYTSVMSIAYRRIGEVTGCSVVVDSSKWPINPISLGMVPSVDPYTVHLLRDPRAVAHSWQQTKRWDPVGEAVMPRFPSAYSAASWLARAATMEVLAPNFPPGRVLTLRYEDLVNDPRATLAQIPSFLHEPPHPLDFITGRTVSLGTNHTVAGNLSRFSEGSVVLSPDERWRTEMQPLARLAATAVALPRLRRYGYPVFMRARRL